MLSGPLRVSVLPPHSAWPQAGGERCPPSGEWRHSVMAGQVGQQLVLNARLELPQVFIGLHATDRGGPEGSIALLRGDQFQPVATAAMGVHQLPTRRLDQAHFGIRSRARRSRAERQRRSQ